MDVLMSVLEMIAVAVVGLLLRVLVAVAGLAVIALPLAAVFLGWDRLRKWLRRRQGFAHAGNLLWKGGLFYAPGHTWLGALADGTLRIGLDDLAQKILPGARVLQFAPVGAHVRRGDPLALLEVGSRRLEIGSPTAGRVVAINRAVAGDATLVHRDPYRRGWLVSLAPSSRAYEALPTGDRAADWLRQEHRRLDAFLESRLGIAAADGGEWILPPTAMLSDEQFEALRREFLSVEPE